MKEKLTYDYEVQLISNFSEEAVETDSVGNQISSPTITTVFCGKQSVTRTEFYNAAAIGLKPSIVLVVHPYEYSGQEKVKFENNYYRVVRSYEVDFENMELTCESVIADN